jgi:hypothetical protein
LLRLLAGLNTLTFDVINYTQNGGNATGLNVEFTPLPASWTTMVIGLAGFAGYQRKWQNAGLAHG